VTLEIARAAGATVNLWDVDLDRVEAEAGRGSATWAGPLPLEAAPAARKLTDLRAAGAAWAIWGWPSSVELVTETIRLAGLQDRRD
jgi:hypothetical protein